MSDIELAERLSRRRARMLPVLALIFLWQQLIYFANSNGGVRLVDHFKIAAWLVLSIVLLLALTTNGFWFRGAAVRALLNDEGTRFNRSEGLRVGFIGAMVACIVVYVLSFFEPLDARAAVHIVMTAGIAAALLRFGILERRAVRDER